MGSKYGCMNAGVLRSRECTAGCPANTFENASIPNLNPPTLAPLHPDWGLPPSGCCLLRHHCLLCWLHMKEVCACQCASDQKPLHHLCLLTSPSDCICKSSIISKRGRRDLSNASFCGIGGRGYSCETQVPKLGLQIEPIPGIKISLALRLSLDRYHVGPAEPMAPTKPQPGLFDYRRFLLVRATRNTSRLLPALAQSLCDSASPACSQHA